jgi:hypothetical protein
MSHQCLAYLGFFIMVIQMGIKISNGYLIMVWGGFFFFFFFAELGLELRASQALCHLSHPHPLLRF